MGLAGVSNSTHKKTSSGQAPHPAQGSSLVHAKRPAGGCQHLLPLPAFAESSFLGVPCVGDCPGPDFSSFFTTSYGGCKKRDESPPSLGDGKQM